MASINAATAGGGGVITTSDATGNLNIQSGGSTVVAVTATGVAVTGTLAATGTTNLGNLTFTGTGNRITGDFSNATLANRVAFQTSTTNSNTGLGVIPNGTGNSTGVRFFNNSDTTNSAALFVGSGATDAYIQSVITGTGTYLPMTFYTGGSERARIDTSGNVGIGTASPAYKLDVVGNTNGNIVGRILNQNVGSSTQAIFQIATGTSGTTYTNMNVNYTGQYFQNAGVGLTTSYQDYDTQIYRNNAGTEQMRIDSAGLLKFNSGYGSAATAYGCRAWVNFNGTGTVAIRASGNVSSITDNGTGNYTVNFTTAMPNANYAANISCTISNVAYPRTIGPTTASVVLAGSIQVITGYPITLGSAVLEDQEAVFISIFR